MKNVIDELGQGRNSIADTAAMLAKFFERSPQIESFSTRFENKMSDIVADMPEFERLNKAQGAYLVAVGDGLTVSTRVYRPAGSCIIGCNQGRLGRAAPGVGCESAESGGVVGETARETD